VGGERETGVKVFEKLTKNFKQNCWQLMGYRENFANKCIKHVKNNFFVK